MTEILESKLRAELRSQKARLLARLSELNREIKELKQAIEHLEAVLSLSMKVKNGHSRPRAVPGRRGARRLGPGEGIAWAVAILGHYRDPATAGQLSRLLTEEDLPALYREQKLSDAALRDRLMANLLGAESHGLAQCARGEGRGKSYWSLTKKGWASYGKQGDK